MKREIKFRGLRVDGEGWVYGNLFYQSKRGNVSPIIGSGVQNGSIMGFRVKPETVGEYTGLKDGLSNPIYEGDIVKDRHGRIMQIGYWNYRPCFIAITKTNFHHADFFDWEVRGEPTDENPAGHTGVLHCEIIGNIFTHSHLLTPGNGE